jgi:chitobiase/beta-hexosaminidase-like protein
MTRRRITHRAVACLIATGVFAAVTAGTANIVSAASANLAQNPSLETGTGAQPDCWLLGGYGTNSYTWSRTGDAHSGSYSETLTISSLSTGDRKLLTGFTTNCSPAVTAGHTYTLGVWYKSNVPVAVFAFTHKTGAAVNSYQWWRQTSLPASSSWTLGTWTTPSMPSGIDQISMGLGLQRTGTVTMDDFSIVDNEANPTPTDTTPPISSMACNGSPCSSGSYSSPVSVSLAASDSGGSGVSSIRYTTDGTTPTLSNGVTYSAPFTVSQTTTVEYRAYDNAGNVEAVHSQQVAIESSAPPPSDNSASGTLPSGYPGLPRTDAFCAAQVYLSTWEPVPANTTANNTVPASASIVPWSDVGIPPSFTKWYVLRALVDGNYKGTTDEIIQWGACKWGIDPDLMRAVAVQESDWKQAEVGDYCGVPGEGSYGLFQVKNAMCDGTGAWGGWPYTANDSALNADFYGASLRACIDGDFQGWLYNGQSISQVISKYGFDYAMWGCVGAWFSGDWYDKGASSYISSVKSHLANRDWLYEGP